jgi:hypothetical protein
VLLWAASRRVAAGRPGLCPAGSATLSHSESLRVTQSGPELCRQDRERPHWACLRCVRGSGPRPAAALLDTAGTGNLKASDSE